MDGTALIKFLLKDLLRPQAMVPNSVVIEKRYIEPPPKPPASGSGQDVDDKGAPSRRRACTGRTTRRRRAERPWSSEGWPS